LPVLPDLIEFPSNANVVFLFLDIGLQRISQEGDQSGDEIAQARFAQSKMHI
jgi:hypothetical protein